MQGLVCPGTFTGRGQAMSSVKREVTNPKHILSANNIGEFSFVGRNGEQEWLNLTSWRGSTQVFAYLREASMPDALRAMIASELVGLQVRYDFGFAPEFPPESGKKRAVNIRGVRIKPEVVETRVSDDGVYAPWVTRLTHYAAYNYFQDNEVLVEMGEEISDHPLIFTRLDMIPAEWTEANGFDTSKLRREITKYVVALRRHAREVAKLAEERGFKPAFATSRPGVVSMTLPGMPTAYNFIEVEVGERSAKDILDEVAAIYNLLRTPLNELKQLWRDPLVGGKYTWLVEEFDQAEAIKPEGSVQRDKHNKLTKELMLRMLLAYLLGRYKGIFQGVAQDDLAAMFQADWQWDTFNYSATRMLLELGSKKRLAFQYLFLHLVVGAATLHANMPLAEPPSWADLVKAYNLIQFVEWELNNQPEGDKAKGKPSLWRALERCEMQFRTIFSKWEQPVEVTIEI